MKINKRWEKGPEKRRNKDRVILDWSFLGRQIDKEAYWEVL